MNDCHLITPEYIKSKSNKIIVSYLREKEIDTNNIFIFDLMDIYETVIYPEYEFQLKTNYDLGDIEGQKILGKTIFSEKLILIDKSISLVNKDPRFIFTLGHEIGHVVLHNENDLQNPTTIKTLSGTKDVIELQANRFAENLIMPDNYVKQFIVQYFNLRKPFKYFGAQEYNFKGRKIKVNSYKEFCEVIAYYLRKYFSNVSKASLGIKISTIGLIDNRTNETINENIYDALLKKIGFSDNTGEKNFN